MIEITDEQPGRLSSDEVLTKITTAIERCNRMLEMHGRDSGFSDAGVGRAVRFLTATDRLNQLKSMIRDYRG